MNALTLDNPSLLEQRLYIDGRWVESSVNIAERVINPATGETIATVDCAGADQVDDAIVAAERALVSWRQVPAAERAATARHRNSQFR